ncbi:hypothetical protein [Ectopseudomonas composti]|uniref:hypothetical protein n=1 Tax=Ectopseudomonas composti TaxID=658457 RepID=UPI00103B27C5|nr:hypothetical protein [Pseudomonas composti]
MQCAHNCGYIFRSSENTQENLDIEERIVIQAKAPIVKAIAAVNPEVAMAVMLLGENSKSISVPVPAKGNMGSARLSSASTVIVALSAPFNSIDLTPYTESVSDNQALEKAIGDDGYSLTSWVFTKVPKSASIKLQHRLYNSSNEEIAQLYPDIALKMRWQASGEAGFWVTESWESQNTKHLNLLSKE